ncbi:hypothetical protein KCV00_g373, partial [Aureobasidium melanogenum]
MSSPALKSILDPYELRRRRKPSRIRYLHLPESTRQPLHQRNPSSDRLCDSSQFNVEYFGLVPDKHFQPDTG